MESDSLTLHIDGAVATLTLNRPDRLNALTLPMLHDWAAMLDTVAARDDIRALILTGAGRGFCAGADLTDPNSGFDGFDDGLPDRGRPLSEGFNPVIAKLQAMPMPVIGAINGPAVGAGVGYALAADIVLAARSAYFLLPFAGLALIPDAGTSWLLPRLIGPARTRAMAMLGEKVDASTAAEWGMIWQAVEDDALLPTAQALAARLAAGPTHAYVRTRALLDQNGEGTLDEAMAAEAAAQTEAGRSADHRTGVMAFVTKTPPRFEGR